MGSCQLLEQYAMNEDTDDDDKEYAYNILSTMASDSTALPFAAPFESGQCFVT